MGLDETEAKPIKIFTLGRFMVEVDGAPLRFKARAQRKPLELLKALVALGGETIAAEKLGESLWPDTEGDQASSALSTTLYRLRKLIGPDALILRDGRLTLDREKCWVDSWAFAGYLRNSSKAVAERDEAAAWEHMEGALALYRGPFLDGEFDPPEILSAREKLHGLYLRHIEEVGELLGQSGQHDKAIALYQRGLEADDLAEVLYQRLMRGYLQLGRHAEGIAVYKRCVEIFKSSVGIAPTPETEAIYSHLASQRIGKRPTDEPARATLMDPAQSDSDNQIEQSERVSAASLVPGGISLDLPDRPSIAVLPFANIGGEPEQEYFSDGITEDIITDLSRLERLFVIASNSVFTYKGKPTDVRKVGKELGVRFVLEGSVRKSGERVRITAQLIDAANGEHLWAQRYDRELQDIFAVQDEITRDIAAELEVKLVYGEQARAWHRSTSNLEAYDLALRAREQWRRLNRTDVARARQLIGKALELDPRFAYAMVLLGLNYNTEGLTVPANSSQACFDRAIELGSQALTLDDSLGDAHAMLCNAFRYKGEHDRALEHGQQAVSLNPDSADSNASFSGGLASAGRGAEAMERIEVALRLNPYPPALYLRYLGGAFMSLGRFGEAIAALRRCVAVVPNMITAQIGLTLAYMEAGQEEEGKAQATQVLRILPEFSSSANPIVNSYKNPATRKRYVNLLSMAGLPE